MQTIINDLGLERAAADLRPGCTLNPVFLDLASLPRGTLHVIVPIEFADGVKWVARIRQKTIHQLPSRVVRLFTQGEIDTMRWLARTEAAPVPKIMSSLYTHGEVDFHFMEMVSGSTFPDLFFLQGDRLSQVRKTIWDYAKVSIRRSQHPLRLIGTLYHDPTSDTFSVGPLLTILARNQTSAQFFGPWTTTAQKYEQRFRDILSEIEAGVLYSDERERAYLVHRWIGEVVVAYPPYRTEEDTFIVHEDLNSGAIMVDAEGSITGLIDWERATVGCKVEAFSTPSAFEDEDLLFAGSNDLSFAEVELVKAYQELGRPDLADCITLGKPFQWLSIMLGGGGWRDYRYLTALGVSLGLEIEESMDRFLDIQKGKFGAELKPLTVDRV